MAILFAWSQGKRPVSDRDIARLDQALTYAEVLGFPVYDESKYDRRREDDEPEEEGGTQ